MSDGESAVEQARLAREKAAQEQRELKRLKEQAALRSQQAETKKKAAAEVIGEQEKEISSLKEQQAVFIKEKKAADAEIAKQDQMLKESAAKLSKLKKETETLRQMRAEQTKKLSYLTNKIQETELRVVRLSSKERKKNWLCEKKSWISHSAKKCSKELKCANKKTSLGRLGYLQALDLVPALLRKLPAKFTFS